jgi:hypothetical protein
LVQYEAKGILNEQNPEFLDFNLLHHW